MSKNTSKPGEEKDLREESSCPTPDLPPDHPPVQLQDEKEVDQDNPQPSSSSTEAKPKKIPQMSHFDRLVPRYSGDTERPKRKAAMMTDSSDTSDKVAAKKSGAKKEYSKLRTLVPALTEREDISKVEIIEETIRYIDALHHQLASRATTTNEQPVDNEDHNDQTSTANAGESTLENPSSSSSSLSSPVSPLKTLLTSETGRRRQGGAGSGAAGTSSSSSTTSSDRSSSHDVKAAVENIQSMFAAYLEHQRSSSSSDESNS